MAEAAAAAPKLIHLVYFPWDRQHGLLPDTQTFDRGPFERLRLAAPDFEVRLWTWGLAEAFGREHYPEVWATLLTAPRPVMIVDVLRWLLVHHYGGIYWQYGSEPLVPMAGFLPAPGREIRLLTETVLTRDFARRMAAEPIRQGQVEERIRVGNQAFAALPGSRFVKAVIDLQLERLKRGTVRCDYDVLFMTGPALVSTAYHLHGRNDKGVELLSLHDSRRMLRTHSAGSWRTDPEPPPAPPTAGVARRMWDRLLDCID
jgi:mannosyltransferase OCH1-like enzyme